MNYFGSLGIFIRQERRRKRYQNHWLRFNHPGEEFIQGKCVWDREEAVNISVTFCSVPFICLQLTSTSLFLTLRIKLKMTLWKVKVK